ncbi:MAG: iron ABC transporter permease [Acidimicrobiales bacterium]|nr:iron ABC transporter permease [Acidimicrobiales bacterium]
MDRRGAALNGSPRLRTRAPRLGTAASLSLAAVPAAFLAIFFVVPVASIVTMGLRPGGRWELGVVADVLGDPALRGVVWFTLWQAVVSTVLTLVVALPVAYALARFEFRGRRLLQAAIMVPFVLPTVVVATAFLALLGPGGPVSGPVGNLFGSAPMDLRASLAAIFIAHVFFNVSVVVRVVGGLLEQLDPHLEDAAASLGAGRVRSAIEVLWPLARSAVMSAAGIVFLFTFTSFGVVLLLGGPRYSTLEVEIHRQTALLLNLPVAAVLALIQLAIVATLLAFGARRQQGAAVQQPLTAPSGAARPPEAVSHRLFLAASLTVLAVLLGSPLAMLVSRSLRTPDGWSARWYDMLFDPDASVLGVAGIEAVRNSLLFAVIATAVAITVGGLASVVVARGRGAVSRAFDVVLLLPLGVSAVTVGFGFLISLDSPPLDFRDSRLLVPMAQALVAVPFVVRVILPVLLSIDQRLREAAAALGASPARVWREVDLPLVGRALGVAAGFAFAISLGEFGATIFLARADMPTVPVAIVRLLGRPGAASIGQAMALSTILMVLTTASLLAISRLRPRSVGS